jgi:hypothetical protein
MSRAAKEEEFLAAFQSAQRSGDPVALESAVSSLALYYVAMDQFLVAALWRQGAELLAVSTAPDSRELATYLYNMAALCLIPAGLRDEARCVLTRSSEIHARHFRDDDPVLRNIRVLIHELQEA